MRCWLITLAYSVVGNRSSHNCGIQRLQSLRVAFTHIFSHIVLRTLCVSIFQNDKSFFFLLSHTLLLKSCVIQENMIFHICACFLLYIFTHKFIYYRFLFYSLWYNFSIFEIAQYPFGIAEDFKKSCNTLDVTKYFCPFSSFMIDPLVIGTLFNSE